MQPPRPLALTSGDPAGIGPDVTLDIWRRYRGEVQPFVLIAHAQPVIERAKALGWDIPIRIVGEVAETARIFRDALPVLEPSAPLQTSVKPGVADSRNANAIIASIDDAVALTARGACSCVVTNPIAKHVLYDAGFTQPGHTEYLGELALSHCGPTSGWNESDVRAPVMMLVSDLLRVAPVTIHVPLKAVPDLLTTDLIVTTVTTIAQAMARDCGVPDPRIAVAGVNPHAGERGTLGREDEDVVTPAIDALRTAGINAFGPLPADTMFHASARATYDVAVTMYHDQGLIPIKTLAFDTGVNATLGLPFIRTSPDHGTAFELAGRGSASPLSLLAAIHCAQAMARKRAAWDATA